MVKHLLNKEGFILVEVIIVLMVLALMILINLQIASSSFATTLYLKETDVLLTELNNARQLAINDKVIVNLSFDKHSLYVKTNSNLEEYKFKMLNFTKSKELYFNKKGALNQAYTLMFTDGFKLRKIIFYLGKGWYKLE